MGAISDESREKVPREIRRYNVDMGDVFCLQLLEQRRESTEREIFAKLTAGIYPQESRKMRWTMDYVVGKQTDRQDRLVQDPESLPEIYS